MTAQSAAEYAARIREQSPEALYRSARRATAPPDPPTGRERDVARLAAALADDISDHGLVVLGAANLLELARREYERGSYSGGGDAPGELRDMTTVHLRDDPTEYDRERVRALADELLREQQERSSEPRTLEDRLGDHRFYR